ncbi:hypothetical protein D8674_024760 [Pyrus ussuriensis x Pyrus communis]|uniref:Uncharacterized protein n=1 Tax=Pyrus ussuriensis x Pyrus communis TaxID=2448454 RepID=A0A5N5H4U8_9ROSA|nr:hypothetical protein D8674_024760 [Pyrus ussuriensis x Pyrus communis]
MTYMCAKFVTKEAILLLTASRDILLPLFHHLQCNAKFVGSLVILQCNVITKLISHTKEDLHHHPLLQCMPIINHLPLKSNSR